MSGMKLLAKLALTMLARVNYSGDICCSSIKFVGREVLPAGVCRSQSLVWTCLPACGELLSQAPSYLRKLGGEKSIKGVEMPSSLLQ